MLKTYFKCSLFENEPKFIIHNISQFFHVWVKRNCNMIENNIYELNIDDLMYISILIYEMEKLNSIYDYIDIEEFKKDISFKFQNEIKYSPNFVKEVYIQEKYDKVYFVIDEYLSLCNNNKDSFKQNIEKNKYLINVINRYAMKNNTGVLYYNFNYD